MPVWTAPKAGKSRPRNDRMDWASLLKRVYKSDVFQCGACGGKARPIAVIQEPEVVKRILRHLGLPEEAPVVEPARREQLELPVGPRQAANELEGMDEPVDATELPAWMRAPGPRERRESRGEHACEDRPVDVARLPAWMRTGIPTMDVKPMRDLELVDEEVDASRLPAWMRSARPTSARRPHWHRREPKKEPVFFADESPAMERLPAWMTWGWQGGPAPPGDVEAVDWDLVDLPSPEGFVDPQYDDDAYFN